MFIMSAHSFSEKQADEWINCHFKNVWAKYDVNKKDEIDEGMVPTYLRSLLGDFSAQFNLRDQDRFENLFR